MAKIRELPIKGPMISTGRSPRVFDQNQAEIEYIPRNEGPRRSTAESAKESGSNEATLAPSGIPKKDNETCYDML